MAEDDSKGRARAPREPQGGQIKSRERVRARGEVFTAPREVNAMLDLVKDETENVDSTFLEPACGDGNFLNEILRRKLAVCAKKYGKSATDYEKFSFLACTTLYGVDIMADNVARCRERLFETWEDSFIVADKDSAGIGRAVAPRPPMVERGPRGARALPNDTPIIPCQYNNAEEQRSRDDGRVEVKMCRDDVVGSRVPRDRIAKSDFHDKVARAVKAVFERNILLGNALSMKRVDERQNDLPDPIVFTEWKFAMGDLVKREEFRFDVLLDSGEKKGKASEMTFDFFGETSSAVNWMIDPDDPEKKRMIPAPSKTYPLIEYWRIGDEV